MAVPRRFAARAVKGAVSVGVHRSEAATLDRTSGRSRRSLSAGRANGNRESSSLHIPAEFVFLKNAMQTEIGKRLALLTSG
jgi:hypothetical protein